MTINTSRRSFLKGAGAAVAVLAVGIDPKGALAASTSEAGTAITPFVKIYADGTVKAVIKHFEGGQGTSTGLSTLIAEELNMELSDITFEMAPSDTAVYNNLFFWRAARHGRIDRDGQFVHAISHRRRGRA